MQNKFFKLFVKDPQIVLRFLLILFFIFLAFLASKKINKQKNELRDLSVKKQLVAQIPELEQKLRLWEVETNLESFEKKQKNSDKSQSNKISLILNGVFIQDDYIIAIINGRIYREGESADNFVVTKITLRSVTLRNKKTGDTLILKL